LGRVVYGTDIPTLVRLGSKQIMLRTKDVFNKGEISMYKTGGNGSPPSTSVPYLHGGIISNETDAAFFSGFSFPYPPAVNSQYYGTDEDVFLRHDGECGCGMNN